MVLNEAHQSVCRVVLDDDEESGDRDKLENELEIK